MAQALSSFEKGANLSRTSLMLAYDKGISEFLLPYDVVRTSNSHDDVLLNFLQSTYEAAATCANWDRRELERP